MWWHRTKAMKRAVLKCVVQMVLAAQDKQGPGPKGRPYHSPKKALKQIQPARVEPESLSDRVSTFRQKPSATEEVVDEEEKEFHCLFGNLAAEPRKTERKYFDYERVPGVSTEKLFGIFFMNEREKGSSVERGELTVFARQHVERVGLGSGRTGHPRLEAPSRLRTAALWGSRAELLPLGPRSAAPPQRCRFQCS